MRLTAVKDRIGVPPDDPPLAATEHALKQWNEIPRIFASPTYRLDNNEVERINRYISLTRRRLTIGSPTPEPKPPPCTTLLRSPATAAESTSSTTSATSSTSAPHGHQTPPLKNTETCFPTAGDPHKNSRPKSGRLSFLAPTCYRGRLYLYFQG